MKSYKLRLEQVENLRYLLRVTLDSSAKARLLSVSVNYRY